MFAFFRTIFGWLLQGSTRKTIAKLLPYAKDAILVQATTELGNAEKKNSVYAALRVHGKRILGEDISEHIIDIVFGSAFGQLRDNDEV